MKNLLSASTIRLSVLYLFVAAFGMEATARIVVYFRTPRGSLFAKGVYIPDDELGYTNAPGTFNGVRINKAGFRGKDFSAEKPSDTFRIICMGNSITFGITAGGDSTTYPALLERGLRKSGKLRKRVEVLNCATNGYTSYQCLLDLRLRVLGYHPDAIILCACWNDIILAKQIGWHEKMNGSLNRDYFSIRESYAFSLFQRVLGFASKVSPDRLERFTRNLEEFGQACDSNRINLMLLDPPTILSPRMNEQEKRHFLKGPFRQGEEDLFIAYRKAILEIARRRGYPLLDSGLTFDESNKDSLVVDNCHPNDQGYERLVMLLCPQVEKLISQDKPGPITPLPPP